VDSAAVTFHQGMNITIVTSAGNNVRGHALMKHLGMPFRVEEVQAKKQDKSAPPAAGNAPAPGSATPTTGH
jgi:hypothetical protein